MKALVPHLHGQSICRLLASLLALGLAPALAESLTVSTPPVSLTADADAAPSLTGEKAVAHLRETGAYDSLSAAMSAARHAVREVEGNPGEAWTANAAHGLHGTFDADGLRLTIRTAEAETFTTNWRLTGLGRDGAAPTENVPAGDLRHADARAEIVRPALGLTEWFANSARGLEHGFTLATRPDGAADAPLRLTLAVTGDLTPVAVRDGQALVLRNADTGATILDYAGLKAWDANGQALAARMETDPATGSVTFSVADTSAEYPLTIDPTFAQQAYLKASNTGGSDVFGYSMAVSGDTVIVGAYGEDSNATGMDGGQGNNNISAAGAAYVFVRSAGVWSQQAYLKAGIPKVQASFGISVAISGDTAVIGAPGDPRTITPAREAYVFTREAGVWSQQARLTGSDNAGSFSRFGESVAISGDTVVIGHGGGPPLAPYVFTRSAGVWSEQARLEPNGGVLGVEFGNSVAVWADTAVVPGGGGTYVFTRSAGLWSQQAYFPSPVGPVAISGDSVVIGAPGDNSSATGVNGDPTDTSAPASGAAYIFTRSAGIWSQQAYLKASNTEAGDRFGRSVALSGDIAVFGAPGEDSTATGVNGDQSDNSDSFSGAAYVFIRNAGMWSQQAYLKASNTGAADQFGDSVAVSGDTAVVGASLEDSNATGVDGNEANNSASGAGAAYVFTLTDIPTPDAYTVWIANYPSIPPALRAPDADADGDGLPNGIEFFCGLDPVADSNAVATDPAAGNRPLLVVQDGLFGLRLTRSDANLALGSGLAVGPALQVFTEAAGWTSPALAPGAGPVLEYLVPPAADATLARLTVTFP